MKKSAIALALALTMAGSLAACSSNDAKPNTSGSNAGSGTAPGQVARRYNGGMNDYLGDGRYTAGSNGRVYSGDGNTVSRDLTQDARDIVRDAGDAIGDVGRGIGTAARDITQGMSGTAGTPSWEPDSSAVRY